MAMISVLKINKEMESQFRLKITTYPSLKENNP